MAAPAAFGHRTLSFQRRAQFRVIVNFAVERQHIAAIGGVHRLMASGRQIDDRQAAVPETDPGVGIEPDPVVVRPAVRKRADHAGDGLLVGPCAADNSRYPAHRRRIN